MIFLPAIPINCSIMNQIKQPDHPDFCQIFQSFRGKKKAKKKPVMFTSLFSDVKVDIHSGL